MRTTHYLPAFTTRDDQQRQRAICGQFVTLADVAIEETTPTCVGCRVYVENVDEGEGDGPMDDDRADHQIPLRGRMSRYDRLQALADSGCDTWAERDCLR
jgi:hypothetical protein